MAVGFGGGPPLLSVLTGAARGISEAQARQEEKQRQALLDSLRQAQDRRAQEEINIAKQRVQMDMQKNALSAAERMGEVAYRREQDRQKAEDAAQQAASDQELIGKRYDELLQNGVNPVAGLIQARREVAGKTNPAMLTGPDPQEQEAARLRNVRLGQQIQAAQQERTLSKAETAILDNPDLAKALEGATTRAEAIDAAAGFDLPESVRGSDIVRAWEDHGGTPDKKQSDETPSGAIPSIARTRVLSMMRTAASQQGLDLSDPEVTQSTADQLLAWVTDKMAQANDPNMPPLSPTEVRMLDEMRKQLSRLTSRGIEGFDALREYGWGSGGGE